MSSRWPLVSENVSSFERTSESIVLSKDEACLPAFLAANSESTLRFTLKRILDYCLAAVAIVLLSPLMLLVALAISWESSGPVFFRQQRMGQRGKLFRIWKFRTMVENAEKLVADLEPQNESEGGGLFKIKSDPRVTRLGRFLRRTSLDELPQLFNVLTGDMSLVGPRPLPIRDCSLLTELHPEGFRRRLEVMPGVTGLWQVSGRSRLGAAKMIELDCEYVERWGIVYDLRIMARTVLVLLFDRGSAC